MSDTLIEMRRTILDALLPNVAFDGWTDKALAHAAKQAGYEAIDARRAFPRGPAQAVAYFSAETDRRMIAALEQMDLPSMRIRDRIAGAVRTRLELLAPHKEAVRRAVAFEALPGNAPRALKAVYRTVDAMWHAAGDTATDWNFYTKRALLAGVYTSTVLIWLADQSEDCAETWAFLDRRIEDVMRIEKAKAKIRGFGDAWRPRRGFPFRPRRAG
jgi:ubiquinone biosynthesis protein COQ9